EREVARLSRRGQRRVEAAEVRQRHAAAITIPAQVTLLPAKMILGDHRQAHNNNEALAIELRQQYIARLLLGRVERPRLHELTIGQLRQAFTPTLHADEL